MKRARAEEPVAPEQAELPELLPELWAHVWHHCAKRERWLVISRQWLKFGNEAVWRQMRESLGHRDKDIYTVAMLATQIHTYNLPSISRIARALWARRGERWASVQFCRGMRMLHGINAFCASFTQNITPVEGAVRCGTAHLLFLDTDGAYTLVDCDVYKHLVRHARGHKVNRTTRLDTLWLHRGGEPRYTTVSTLLLPVGLPVRYCERYEPQMIALDTTWWIFVVGALHPHELARFLSRKYAMDWAKRRCGTLLLQSLMAPVAQ